MVRVPDQRVAVAVEDLGGAVRPKPHTSLSTRAKPDRLTVLEIDPVLLVLADEVEGAVVEDVAVLEDLDERASLVRGGGAEDVGQLGAVGVDRPRDERRLGADRE